MRPFIAVHLRRRALPGIKESLHRHILARRSRAFDDVKSPAGSPKQFAKCGDLRYCIVEVILAMLKVIAQLKEMETPSGGYTEEAGLALADFMNRKHQLTKVKFEFRPAFLDLIADLDENVHDEIQGFMYLQEAESFLAGYGAGHHGGPQESRMIFCPLCSQVYDMKAPNGRYTLGHELACSIVTGEGIGCSCSRSNWPICADAEGGGCGQVRPPKVETCSCTGLKGCRHAPGECGNKILETDWPKACISCGREMGKLYTESVQ